MGAGHTLDANTLGLWRFDDALVDTRGVTFVDSNALAWTAAEAIPTICSYSPVASAYARRFISGAAADPGKKSSLTRATSAGIRSMMIGSWTLELYVRFDSNLATVTNWVTSHTGASSSETSANNTLLGLAMLASGALFVAWETGSGTNVSTTWTFTPTMGTWYYLAISKNTATKELKLYVDGVLNQTLAYASEPTDGSTGTWCIGSGEPSTTVGSGFDGAIRDISWSSVVRDQTWVTANQALKTTTGLLATDGSTHTKFTFSASPAAIDLSPNEFHLISAGSASDKITGPSASLIRDDVLGGMARSFNNCLLYGRYSDLVRNAMLADFTVEAFVQLMAPTPANSSVVFLFGGDTFLETEVANVAQCGVQQDGSVYMLVENGAGVNAGPISAAGLITIGQIYHLAFRKTMTGATWTGAIFIDGVKVVESTGLANYTGGNDLETSILSVGGGTQAVFFGYLDDVRLSNIARTDAEIVNDAVAGGDVAGPIVLNVIPTPGTDIAVDEAIQFDVTDASGVDLSTVVIDVYFFDGSFETVYTGSAFSAAYNDHSTVSVITDGFQFSIRRDADWRQLISRITITASDNVTNASTSTIGSWVLLGTAPIITVTPIEGSVISRATTLRVTVTTAGSLRRVVISALFGGSTVEEVVHTGVGFAASYTGGSNARVDLGNGYQFTILKLGGWRGSSVTLRVAAIDTFGSIAQKTVGSSEVLYTWQVDDSTYNLTPFMGAR